MTGGNKGSAIIEMTLLTPIIMGIIYLYICLFLFLIDSTSNMKYMVEVLYAAEEELVEQDNMMQISTKGSKRSVYIEDETGMYDIDLELHRNEDVAIENIRRWQFAANTVRAGGNE